MSSFIIVLMLLAFGVADARLPQVGDHVVIEVATGFYEGSITDIGDGLICLNLIGEGTQGDSRKDIDICIGVGSIFELTWI